ncbi:MAG: serine/threonine protein kinase [Candidatus Brocadiaceae bacterium]|nr:serine/threonine protein kinase [Candidatus Brocadiaceae bacterium]
MAFVPPLTQDEIEAAVGGLRAIRSLGEGGQGCVWLAEASDGSPAALKVYARRDNVQVRVEREVEALRDLRCDSIVELVDWGQTQIRGEDCVYTLTGYIDGPNLHELLGAGQLAESRVVRVCQRIAQAIDAMWALRIVHRDVKPENIVVARDGSVFLIDLGIAKHLDKTTLTLYGRVWGTPGYMSPEQMAGRPGLTLRSDLFSLGIVAYEAVSGSHPFGGRQDLIGRVDPPHVRDRCGVSARVASSIHWLLKARPVDRPSSGAALIADLSE